MYISPLSLQLYAISVGNAHMRVDLAKDIRVDGSFLCSIDIWENSDSGVQGISQMQVTLTDGVLVEV